MTVSAFGLHLPQTIPSSMQAIEWRKTTNIPRDFAKAARSLGMKYGFYVSPWDRNSKYYGTEKYVNDVFLRQCAELAQYGKDQFEMWFDGANGGDGYYGGRNTTVNVEPLYLL